MTQAQHIINRFGGLSALARALGHKHPSTVQGWKERGFVPAHQQQAVLDAARSSGIKLRPSDFFLATSPAEGDDTTPSEDDPDDVDGQPQPSGDERGQSCGNSVKGAAA